MIDTQVEQPVETGSTPLAQASENFEASLTKQPEPSVLDLEKTEKFLFDGREWTAKELKNAYMAHADYTRKTQALAQERKFMENLEADLDAIRGNPALAEEFKRIYPQSYHKYLKYAMQADSARTQPQANSPAAIPEVSELTSKVQQLEDYFQKLQMKELESQFSSIFNNQIKSKYSWVDEDRLAGLAREAMQMGYKLRDENGQIDGAVLEQIAKFEHERLEKKFQDYQKTTIEKQRAANKSARDIGSGGGIPGQAPKKMSFKEATEAAIRDLSAQRS